MANTVNVDFITKVVEIQVNDNEAESLAAQAAINAAARADEAKDLVVDNLQDSLDAIDEKTETEKTELDDYTETKKTEVATLGQGYVDSASQKVAEANTILSAIRNEYGYPFTASTAADMTDTSKIYVYVGNETGYVNGNWYYNNGTAWVSGGVYNSTAFETDAILTVSGAAADAKATGQELNSLLFGIKRPYPAMLLYGKTVQMRYADVAAESGFVTVTNNAIDIHQNNTHKYIKIPSDGIKSITITPTGTTTTYAFVIFEDKNGNAKNWMRGDIAQTTTIHFGTPYVGGTVYINCWGGGGFPESATIEFFDERDFSVSVAGNKQNTVDLLGLPIYGSGFVQSDGGFYTQSASNQIVEMDASYLREVSFKSNTVLTNGNIALGVVKDSSGNTVKVLQNDKTTNIQTFKLEPQKGNILYISYLNYGVNPNQFYDTVSIKNYVAPDTVYKTCVKKPFDFTNKMLYFFGDSITYGYIAESGDVPAHQATNNYPKVFANAVGASYVNHGVSGSTLSEVSGYGCIFDKIQSITLNCDVLFVAGGINDWQLGVDEETLKDAVEDICQYLQSNFNGEVVFITPINEAGKALHGTPVQSVQNVRNVITRIALKYGYSVVEGNEFPFPLADDDPDYISLVFQDKLHPTELGYALYAQSLRSAVC